MFKILSPFCIIMLSTTMMSGEISEVFLAVWLPTLGQDNPIRYRGYYYDTETKLYYVSSRYYSPEILPIYQS